LRRNHFIVQKIIKQMRHGSLFSGIGGFDLAAEWMGWENLFHCEWNEFGQKVLNYYWPDAESFTDITKTDFTKYANSIDVLTGGFPCQPYSNAGERLVKEDERHLWPEMLRAIREIKPGWIVGENVFGLLNWNGGLVFDEVQANLEAEGYQVIPPAVLPACAVDAFHRRDRVWFIAYSDSKLLERIPKQHSVSDRDGEGWRTPGTAISYPAIGGLYRQGDYRDIRRGDGLSDRLDAKAISVGGFKKESIKAYGNAIHPKVAFQIFKAIEQYSKDRNVQECDASKDAQRTEP
jgi:DNA (cytosine-5)-methyltransferase 1